MPIELSFEGPILELEKKIEDLKKLDNEGKVNFKSEISRLEAKRDSILKEIYKNLTPWQITQVARHPERPQFYDYANLIFDDFIELHGDRSFGDDKAIVTGFCNLGDEKVIGTDCVFRGEQFIKDHPWYDEVSVAPLIAKVIHNINRKLSVSELLS